MPVNICSINLPGFILIGKSKKYVGSCELIFTRSMEGRQLLLKSRIKALLARFDGNTDAGNSNK